jgi:hypothetical protein
MIEERHLSKTEAALGLTLIGALLIGLVCAYIHQLDEPAAAVPLDRQWESAQSTARSSTAIEQTAYRPAWLSPQSEEPDQQSAPPATYVR